MNRIRLHYSLIRLSETSVTYAIFHVDDSTPEQWEARKASGSKRFNILI